MNKQVREACAGERITARGGKFFGRDGEVTIPDEYVVEVVAVPTNSPEGEALKTGRRRTGRSPRRTDTLHNT